MNREFSFGDPAKKYFYKILFNIPSMAKTVKILILNNAIEATLLDGLLNEKGIPHLVRSHHDSVYDGLFQLQTGWGQLDAPEEYKEEILMIYNEMSESD
jgi:hypothetical protein